MPTVEMIYTHAPRVDSSWRCLVCGNRFDLHANAVQRLKWRLLRRFGW